MTPRKIILHHSLTKDSGTVSWQAIRRYHVETNGWRDIGYHFGVELVNDTYELFVGRMVNEVGAHTLGQNSDSIGVCLVGNFDLAEPSPEQWATAVRLCRGLRSLAGIPASQIFGHRDFAAKSCPGKFFDLERFRRDVMRIPA